MEIGPLSNRPQASGPDGQPGVRPETQRSPQAGSRVIVDRAEISGEARARLAEMADAELAREQQEPQPAASGDHSREERLELIKNRIASGYYSDPEVRSKLVDRLIDDLDA